MQDPLTIIFCFAAAEERKHCRKRFANFIDIPIRLKQVAQLLREGGGHGRHRRA